MGREPVISRAAASGRDASAPLAEHALEPRRGYGKPVRGTIWGTRSLDPAASFCSRRKRKRDSIQSSASSLSCVTS
jgi:hypothetical protein